jgi:hypothetical protein
MAALGLTLLACSTVTAIPLPRDEFPNECPTVGLEATLTGSPNDPRLAWLSTSEGRRVELVWPPGYGARFAPDLEVLNESGSVVFRAGDVVDGGCVKGPPDDLHSVFRILPDGG